MNLAGAMAPMRAMSSQKISSSRPVVNNPSSYASVPYILRESFSTSLTSRSSLCFSGINKLRGTSSVLLIRCSVLDWRKMAQSSSSDTTLITQRRLLLLKLYVTRTAEKTP